MPQNERTRITREFCDNIDSLVTLTKKAHSLKDMTTVQRNLHIFFDTFSKLDLRATREPKAQLELFLHVYQLYEQKKSELIAPILAAANVAAALRRIAVD